jgi:hypothetical protein
MTAHDAPKWLRSLEKHLGWIALPNIALIVVTLQALGFLMVSTDIAWGIRLALVPDAVLGGEWWRVITFMALPISSDPIWVLFALWFLWFLLGSIEAAWGAFRTTFYVLFSLLVTIGFSFAFNYPITSVKDFESTLFLAAAALFPEMEVRLFFFVPVRMKWLAWVAGLMVGWNLIQVGWVDRLYLGVVYSNFLLFFGPALFSSLKNRARRAAFRAKMRD